MDEAIARRTTRDREVQVEEGIKSIVQSSEMDELSKQRKRIEQ